MPAREKFLKIDTPFEQAVSKALKNPAAVALGRAGGLKGGKARAASLSPERRSEIAQVAADTRWGGEKRQKRPVERERKQWTRTKVNFYDEILMGLQIVLLQKQLEAQRDAYLLALAEAEERSPHRRLEQAHAVLKAQYDDLYKAYMEVVEIAKKLKQRDEAARSTLIRTAFRADQLQDRLDQLHREQASLATQIKTVDKKIEEARNGKPKKRGKK